MVRRTKEDAVATRISLIDAAERVFYEKGVSGASLSDIARSAGITRGAIYWHFKDKVDLFGAMMDRVTLPLEQGCRQFEEVAVPDPVQRLRDTVAFVLHSVSSDARVRRVFEIAMYKVEYVGELGAVRDRHIASCDLFVSQLARDFDLAAAGGGLSLPLSSRDAAIGLHALADGLMQGWILGGGQFDLEVVGGAAADAFLAGLGLSLPQVRSGSGG